MLVSFPEDSILTKHIIKLKTDATIVEIEAKSEWRFEVAFEQKLLIKVVEGNAEIFGTELANDIEYKFTGAKASIYTHEGCKLQYQGEVSSEYISEETEMGHYINLHLALENIRNTAGSKAPNVLILGAKDSGKTTLAKILSSYALRMDRQPMLVNLDPSNSVFSIPGSLTATPISDIFDVEEGWGNTYTSGPTLLHPKQPNVRYYGYDDINTNLKFYKENISRLGLTALSRLQVDLDIKRTGMIVDTPPLGLKNIDLIQDIVSDFEISVIVVVGNERLFIDLRKKFNGRLSLVKIPKSAGVVEIDDAFKRKLQQRAIREYFHGTASTPLSPYTANVDYKYIKAYKPASGNTSVDAGFNPSIDQLGYDLSAVTGDAKSKSKLIESVENNSANLLYAVVAILHADKKDDEDVVARSSVFGFAVISGADDDKHFVRILLPVPGRVPDKAMIVGEFRYTE
ncbi:hypothetical protein WICPIJ_003956 [Wickerhamomyces pijperi]|uniref:Polynucleotide 5'-hydroxyl-kinase GRC3 n=1 Tax=Wickerhamomyces pijperi TaxID=599730 RepID=A0A9P8Q904_WICPI|nr:hypothetical protein WICPIJ_003956 [Wickerhamomyces pijperi]